MNKAAIALLLLAGSAALWWWFGHAPTAPSSQGAGLVRASPPLSAEQRERRRQQATPSPTSAAEKATAKKLIDDLARLDTATPEQRRRMLTGNPMLRKVYLMTGVGVADFDFFGQIIDQFDLPVSGAKVKYRASGGYLSEGSGSGTTISDAEGNFAIREHVGKILKIEAIEKHGYEIDLYQQTTTFYSYNKYPGQAVTADTSADNPHHFVAWQKDQSTDAKTVVRAKGVFSLAPDGRWYTLDLKAARGQRKIEGRSAGHLRARLLRSGRARDGDANWQLDIEVVDGGIQPAEGIYTYEAPNSGYTPGVTLTGAGTEPLQNAWSHYFLSLQSGREYARLSVSPRPFFDSDTGAVMMDYSFSNTRSLDTFAGYYN